jgi:hypothetical protein
MPSVTRSLKPRHTIQVFADPKYVWVAATCDVPGETRRLLISEDRTSLGSLDIAYSAPGPRPEVFRIRPTSLSLPDTGAKGQSVA